MKKTALILFTVFFSSLIMGSSSNDVSSHIKKFENTKIELALNARSNGYKVIEERQKIYVQAINVLDPIEKKRVEGEGKLRIICDEKRQLQASVDALFDNGGAGRILTPCRSREIQKILAIVTQENINQ